MNWSLSAGAIRDPLLGIFLKVAAKDFPTEVDFNFKYVIRARTRRLEEVTRDNLLAPIFSNSSWDSIA
ncbi:hypothetical protein [Bradyrhizobium sp. CCBAU 51753]|uniref:hypothetical protein n=1 Tax=Bradyrhizobium sp. CCBAU 51753 TaxID=1325100 RepID=UPI00188CC848|nr:hypothetical protein [Bradyrhizobium sp. CCBAU 51753]